MNPEELPGGHEHTPAAVPISILARAVGTATGRRQPEPTRRRAALFLLIAPAAVLAAEKKPVPDGEIYDAVRRRLANDADVKGGALQIEVKDGVVTIQGSVEYEKQKAKAERLARKVNGVKQVVNQLTISRKAAR